MDPLLEFALSVKAMHRELERLMNEATRPLGLTAAQAEAVVVIGQAEPLSLKELGELLIAEAGHPSRLVDRLVDAGLVERHAAGDDRRRIELSLTPRGRVLQERILAAHEGILEHGRGRVGDRDLGPALELLRHLLAGSPYAELINRRRELLEAGPRAAETGNATRSTG
ncbi:MAG: winged helix DNA-binding protein [Streptosporangiales bacterium]|nr:winged helix DNA-binding protein [Streptosporangiales bacterium]